MALPNGIDSTEQLLRAQSHLWNHIYTFINSMSLKCAIQLGVADAIHDHGVPMTLPQLAAALAINESKSSELHRLMRILTHSGFFQKVRIPHNNNNNNNNSNGNNGEEGEDEGYSLTLTSRLLLKDDPMSMAPFALAILDPVKMDPWHRTSEWFRDGNASPFVSSVGRNHWERVGADERLNGLFNRAMASDAGIVVRVLARECRHVFEGLETMVDVGGGIGVAAKGIADAFPGLKCTVLDLPHVVAGLEGSHNLSYVSGDMFVSVPHADAVFLKWVLHDWSDEDCVKILKNSKEAISDSENRARKVIVVEVIVDDQKEDHQATETQLLFDMQMMVQVSGKERTEREWGRIIKAAGFGNYKITSVGLRSVIEAFP